MKRNFADLHCHPHGRSFNYLRNTRHRNGKKYNPWTIILSNWRKQRKGARAFSYSQCDLAKLQNGNGRIIFASLYPIEKGFFRGGGKIDGEGVRKIQRFLDSIPPLGFITRPLFNSAVRSVLSSKEGRTSAKDLFQSLLMRMPLSRVNFIQSSQYDYYQELKEEYQFLISKTGLKEKAKIHGPLLKRIFWPRFPGNRTKQSTKAEGTYTVAKDFKEVDGEVKKGNIVFIVTIEGMHALGTDKQLPEVFKRIEEIKNWIYPVFFITFAHHFNNYLCGHAHSFPNIGKLLLNQDDGMHEPMNKVGLAAARYLLSLDKDNNHKKNLGRRIFLDVKHMGATARKQYYEEIVEPCLGKHDVIPVIASHVGYSGVETLDEMISNYGNENDEPVDGLNNWNINVCDEDILMILRTEGLLGLSFDERILGQNPKKKDKVLSKKLIWNNIKGILDAVEKLSSLNDHQKEKIWDVLTIGTDFDGYIDPADEYQTALEYSKFAEDLESLLETEIFSGNKQNKYFVRPNDSAEELVNKICFENVHKFLNDNF